MYIILYAIHTKVKPPSDWVFCYCNKSVIPNASCLKYSEVLSPYFFCLQDRLKDLNGQADSLMASNAFDTTQVKDKRDAVNGRFAKIKNMAASRRAKLNESHRLHQFFRDLDDEESWIKWESALCSYYFYEENLHLNMWNSAGVPHREKKLLVSSEDYGRDLTGVQNLRKKHKRLEAELGAHEPAIQVEFFIFIL